VKILIIDDHALIREAWRGVLKELQGALLDGSVIEGSDTVNVFPESCLSPFAPLLQ